MAKIKTKNAIKKTIKTLDKAAIASARMKSAYVKTKNKAEQSYKSDENSIAEYADNRIAEVTDTISRETVYRLDRQGRKSLKKHERMCILQRTKWLTLRKKGLNKN